MLTDGLVEVANKHDEEFGLPAIKDVLAHNAARPLSEILTALITASNLHGQAEDDRSLLLVKFAN
jgi:serine phosphatase RsbU (regulator of sigma subunit)